MRSIEPGISRFRVWCCAPSRNDRGEFRRSASHNDAHCRRIFASSQRTAPESFPDIFARLQTEGVGNAGCPVHPQPLSMHTGVHSLASVACELTTPPARLGSRKTFADLTPATGARTTRFAVRFNAGRPARRSSLTESNPPSNATSRPTLPRPPHPIPTFVTIAKRPLIAGRDGVAYKGNSHF
jgi:hypothetical protein